MSQAFDWIVVGGGFRSIVGAYALAKRGEHVCLVEAGPKIGGFIAPIPWEGFWIDKGPQFFDSFTDQDITLMDDMIGPDLLEDIGYSYASYTNGALTDGFAIPDWRNYGDAFVQSAFFDLLDLAEHTAEKAGAKSSLAEVLDVDGGTVIGPLQREMCKKMLQQAPEDLGAAAANMITFVGRKLLLDDSLSKKLKQSPLLDEILAAQKISVGEPMFNLYPKDRNLNTIRLAFESALDRVGVKVLTDTKITGFSAGGTSATLSDGNDITGASVLFGGHIAEAEGAIFGADTIARNIAELPEIFHFFLVPAHTVHGVHYAMDYDLGHKTSRVTNFCNYMDCIDDEGYGVICVEQPIVKDSAQWEYPQLDQDAVFEEVRQMGLAQGPVKKSASIKVPSTYKLPKPGYEDAVATFKARVQDDFGARFVIPDAFGLTRKNGLDSLREIDVLRP